MGNFTVTAYNHLLSIHEAHERFATQLSREGITREQLFTKLAPLFAQGEHSGRYAVCLMHRHYSLNPGKRMVTNDFITQPSVDFSSNIISDQWSSTGEEIEHSIINNPTSRPPPPSADFTAKFKSVIDEHGVTVLGVCYAPENLPDGYELMEMSGPGDRVQLLSMVRASSVDKSKSYQAVWIPGSDGCHRSCVNCFGTGHFVSSGN